MEHKLYEGLNWIDADAGQERQGILWTAAGISTPHHYRVRSVDGGVQAFAGFGGVSALQAGWVCLGSFDDGLYALLACERHDFAYAVLPAERMGQTLVFAGSDRTRDLVDALTSVPDGTEIMDLLSNAPRVLDGRIFHRVASFFDAAKSDLRQAANGAFTLSVTCAARALPLWLMEAPKGTQLSVGVVKLLEGDDSDDWRQRGIDALKRSHMLPADPMFCQWMMNRYDRWGLIAAARKDGSDAVSLAVGETLKRYLGIPTRKGLMDNRDAIERMERMDRDYYRDMSMVFNSQLPSEQT